MFVIEYFVGSARGKWLRGRRRYGSLEAAQAVVSADWQNESRNFGLPILRRVAAA